MSDFNSNRNDGAVGPITSGKNMAENELKENIDKSVNNIHLVSSIENLTEEIKVLKAKKEYLFVEKLKRKATYEALKTQKIEILKEQSEEIEDVRKKSEKLEALRRKKMYINAENLKWNADLKSLRKLKDKLDKEKGISGTSFCEYRQKLISIKEKLNTSLKFMAEQRKELLASAENNQKILANSTNKSFRECDIHSTNEVMKNDPVEDEKFRNSIEKLKLELERYLKINEKKTEEPVTRKIKIDKIEKKLESLKTLEGEINQTVKTIENKYLEEENGKLKQELNLLKEFEKWTLNKKKGKHEEKSEEHMNKLSV